MSAIPKRVSTCNHNPDAASSSNQVFLKLLPAVKTHAAIQFRHLNRTDREEAIAEAAASAFLNFETANRNGTSHRITPGTLAHYAVLHVWSGRHSGGSVDGKNDVMSRVAQRRHGFKVVGLPWNSEHVYDCLRDPTSPVWKQVLLEDKATPVLDQAAFRIDWSMFLGQQTDRTRSCMALLAEGHKRCEVADRMGTTPPAVTQRMARVEREWDRFQGVPSDERNKSEQR
jgi:hypothetical protein